MARLIWSPSGAGRCSLAAEPSGYITPDRPDRFWFETYSRSARRFPAMSWQQGQTRHLEPHGLRWIEDEAAGGGAPEGGEPHPHVIGNRRRATLT